MEQPCRIPMHKRPPLVRLFRSVYDTATALNYHTLRERARSYLCKLEPDNPRWHISGSPLSEALKSFTERWRP